MLASISFNQSHKSSLSHNNREHTSGNKDIDPDRSHLNIYFVKEDIRNVYEELFQDAVDAYNAKQTRADRKIDNYYEKIHNDSKTHEQRELVVAIGEGKDPDYLREGKREALVKYAEEFQDRNPNLRVYNMVLHDDEANPHLHINYVPNFESKRGLQKRVGMDKALQQQGVEGKGTQLIGNWRASETARIEALAKEHMPEFERANVGSHKYMKVPEYKEYAEALQEVEKEFEEKKADVEAADDAKRDVIAKLKDLEKQKEAAIDQVIDKHFELNNVERTLSYTKMELQEGEKKLGQLKKKVANIEEPLVELESVKTKKILNQVTLPAKDYEKVLNMAKKSLEENKAGAELQRQNLDLKKQITEQKKVEQDQAHQIKAITQQKDKLKLENKELKKENRFLLLQRNVFGKLYVKLKEWALSHGVNKENLEKNEKTIERKEKQKMKEKGQESEHEIS